MRPAAPDAELGLARGVENEHNGGRIDVLIAPNVSRTAQQSGRETQTTEASLCKETKQESAYVVQQPTEAEPARR